MVLVAFSPAVRDEEAPPPVEKNPPGMKRTVSCVDYMRVYQVGDGVVRDWSDGILPVGGSLWPKSVTRH